MINDVIMREMGNRGEDGTGPVGAVPSPLRKTGKDI
jgi:hypothetical protein